GRVDMGGVVHRRGDALRQHARLGVIVNALDLDVLEIGPVRRLIAEAMRQIVELQPHAVVVVLLERDTTNFCYHGTPPFRMAIDAAHYVPGLCSSGLVLAMRIRDSAALRSSFRNAANSSGVVGAETTACVLRNSLNFGSLNSATNSRLSRATMAGGVPRGAASPHQP